MNEQPSRSAVRVSPKDCPSPHSTKNKLGRVAWGIVWALFFRTSPRPFYGWRRWLLRLFGAGVDRTARVAPAVKIWAPWNLTLGEEAAVDHGVDCYCVGPITIGGHATVSRHAFLCAGTHDVSDPNMSLIVRPVDIGDGAWVCAAAFVGPGVRVAKEAVVGAAAVVVKDVGPREIVAGNPARVIGQRTFRGKPDEEVAPVEPDRPAGGEA